MGLSISVGLLAYNSTDEEVCDSLRRQFEAVNRLLKSNKLPPHEEPETLPKLKYRERTVIGQPYDNLHHLRRAVAYAIRRHTELPDFGDADPVEDEMLDRVMDCLESHVICHSD